MKSNWLRNGMAIIVLFTLLALQIPAAAAAGENPGFRLAAIEQEAGISVEIFGDELQDVYAYELRLSYDEEKLKLIKAEIDITGFTAGPIVEQGTIRLVHTKVGKAASISGSERLAVLQLEWVGGGSAQLMLNEVELVNASLEVFNYSPEVQLQLLRKSELNDIASHWAEASIQKAVKAGIVNGYDDGTFRPDREVTRAEFTVMLMRALSKPGGLQSQHGSSHALSYADAQQIPNWAEEHVARGSVLGLLNGYENNTFRPQQPITRSEATAILVRAAGLDGRAGEQLSFADSSRIASWAAPYVQSAVSAGLIGGRDGNRFAPEARTTRAEAAVLMLRVVRLIEERHT